MKINNLNAHLVYSKMKSLENKCVKSNTTTKIITKQNTDTIEISDKGAREYDMKVADIKNKIATGKYKIDADKIAKKMISSLYI